MIGIQRLVIIFILTRFIRSPPLHPELAILRADRSHACFVLLTSEGGLLLFDALDQLRHRD
jgi:hypothetical protein